MAFDQADSVEKFEQMFTQMQNGEAKCKVCQKIINIKVTPEIEYWKHQLDGEHFNASIKFILLHFQEGKQNRNNQKTFRLFDLSKAKKLQAQGMDELDEYIQEQTQKVIEMLAKNNGELNRKTFDLLVDKMKEMIEQGVDSVQLKFFEDFEEELESFDEDHVIKMANRLGITQDKNNQKPPKLQKKYQKKEWKQEPFLLSYNDYFKSFVEDLIKENQLLEGSCFLLARLGITAQQMLNLKISKIPQLIRNAQNTQAKPETWIDEIFLQMITKFTTDERFKNKDSLVQDCNNVKELRRRLLTIRNQIQKNTTDLKFQAFLRTLRVKALNALWKTGQKRAIMNMQEQPQPTQVPVQSQTQKKVSQNDDKILESNNQDKENDPLQDPKKNVKQQVSVETQVQLITSENKEGQNELAQSKPQETISQQDQRNAQSPVVSSEQKIKDQEKPNKYDRYWVKKQKNSQSSVRLHQSQEENKEIQVCHVQQLNEPSNQFLENQ